MRCYRILQVTTYYQRLPLPVKRLETYYFFQIFLSGPLLTITAAFPIRRHTFNNTVTSYHSSCQRYIPLTRGWVGHWRKDGERCSSYASGICAGKVSKWPCSRPTTTLDLLERVGEKVLLGKSIPAYRY